MYVHVGTFCKRDISLFTEKGKSAGSGTMQMLTHFSKFAEARRGVLSVVRLSNRTDCPAKKISVRTSVLRLSRENSTLVVRTLRSILSARGERLRRDLGTNTTFQSPKSNHKFTRMHYAGVFVTINFCDTREMEIIVIVRQ